MTAIKLKLERGVMKARRTGRIGRVRPIAEVKFARHRAVRAVRLPRGDRLYLLTPMVCVVLFLSAKDLYADLVFGVLLWTIGGLDRGPF